MPRRQRELSLTDLENFVLGLSDAEFQVFLTTVHQEVAGEVGEEDAGYTISFLHSLRGEVATMSDSDEVTDLQRIFEPDWIDHSSFQAMPLGPIETMGRLGLVLSTGGLSLFFPRLLRW